jgi:pimeloyl-ACP methyl ester carboxylesterase
MEYEAIHTNDGAKLAYQTSLSLASARDKTPKSCLLLLHGFSGSSQYFVRNTESLKQSHWVVAPDMRGHGQSDRTEHGYHVARLAMDLHDIITKVILTVNPEVHVYAVGCSIGAAVSWTYVELFGDAALSGFVFVDQAPLQDQSLFGAWGKGLHHYGCYDEATMLAAQNAWASSSESVREETYRGLVDSCLGYRYAPLQQDNITKDQRESDEEFFTSISRVCDGVWLAKLLADHTRYDHREAISLIQKPILVMAGQRSGCFSIDAQEEIVRRAARCPKLGTFPAIMKFSSGHWLFWEQPEEFNNGILNFVRTCADRKSEA